MPQHGVDGVNAILTAKGAASPPSVGSALLWSGPNKAPAFGNQIAVNVKGSLPSGIRAIAIGDSVSTEAWYTSFFLSQTTGAIGTGGFVVSKGIAYLTFASSGHAPLTAGNYVHIYNRYDTTFKDALNGACVPVLSTGANGISSFQVSATYAGNTMPDGDYSAGYAGQPWSIVVLPTMCEGGYLSALNWRNGNPVQFVANYSMVGAPLSNAVTLMSQNKILSGPKFDIAFISTGINECQLHSAVSDALIGAEQAYENMVAIATQILATGAMVVLVPDNLISINVTVGQYPKNCNIALLRLRTLLIQYQQRTPGVYVLDIQKDSILGTYPISGADFLAPNYINPNDVHLSSFGAYNIAKTEANFFANNSILPPLELSAISVLEDQTSNAQAIVAWAQSTVTAVGAIVSNYPNVYVATAVTGNAQTASSGTGPSGTGTGIIDGNVTWAFSSIDTRNWIQHGMMDHGTGGSFGSSGVTGAIPAGWIAYANGTAANYTCTFTDSQTRAGSSPQSNWGYGANVVYSTTDGASYPTFRSNDASSSLTGKGGWYRASVTIAPQANFSHIKSLQIWARIYMTTGAIMTASASNAASATVTTVPMLSADSPLEMTTQPFYIDPSQACTGAFIEISPVPDGTAGASASFQIANVWFRQVPNPYA